MKDKYGLTYERLLEVLHYDPKTGLFTWKVSLNQRIKIGSIAGVLSKHIGYRLVRIDGTLYLAHRLAFFYQTGSWPKGEVDHINMDRADNRFSNLRDGTHSQNMFNQRKRRTNKSGFKGVYSYRGRWDAEIWTRGKKKWLGSFDTPEAAHAAYVDAAIERHGEFARG